MNDEQRDQWFQSNKELLESAYLKGQQPWQQSGFGLRSEHTYETWEAQRRPVADCMDKPGTFLDIGCANGYLLECVLRWTAPRGVEIVPYGLDLSEKLCQLARERLPQYAKHIWAGNTWSWIPPRKFTYVRTELVYVPSELHAPFVHRLLDLFVEKGGKLLIAEYRGRNHTTPQLAIDIYLASLGFTIAEVKSGHRDGVEQTRVAAIRKAKASQ